LLLDFNTPSHFITPLKGIRILGVPLDISSFISSFIKNALLKDVHHVDLLLKMDDVQVAFGIITHYFMQWPLYILQCTFPFSTLIKSLIYFNSYILQVFRRFLGPRSFDSLKGPIINKQVSLPITFDGIGLIPIATIALLAYLWNWAFIASFIATRFMVNQRPFLLETLAQIDNNTFPFEQHLKTTCDLLLP